MGIMLELYGDYYEKYVLVYSSTHGTMELLKIMGNYIENML